MLFQLLHQLDISIFNWINHWPHPAFLNTIASLMHFGTRGLVVYILLWIILLIYKKYKPMLYLALSMIVTMGVIDLGLKHLIARPRPFQVISNVILLTPLPTSWSFPSSETAVAFTVAMTATLIFQNPRWRWAWAWAILTGVDRIYMGHHYPSDVLGGALVGVLVAYLAVKLLDRTKFKLDRSDSE